MGHVSANSLVNVASSAMAILTAQCRVERSFNGAGDERPRGQRVAGQLFCHGDGEIKSSTCRDTSRVLTYRQACTAGDGLPVGHRLVAHAAGGPGELHGLQDAYPCDWTYLPNAEGCPAA